MIDELIDRYQLEPHPEGGFYRRVFEHPQSQDGRPLASAIVYLLPEGVTSRWHRIDAVELWHAGTGAPLVLSTSSDGMSIDQHTLGGDDEVLLEVPSATWQCARSTGEWSLVTVTVVPAFSWEGFELAPEDWSPGS